jgi:hypothetical protein
VLDVPSVHLRARIGRGYSTTNLRYFRTFYLAFRDRVPEIRHIGGGESPRPGRLGYRTCPDSRAVPRIAIFMGLSFVHHDERQP